MADKKVSQLPSLTTTAAPDLLLIVDDPLGTPVSKNITVKNFFGAVPANTTISGHVLPGANVTYDLGSSTKAWRSLYVSNNTIYIGGKALTVADNGSVLVDGDPITGGGVVTRPTPSITYTGTFGDEPPYWTFTDPKKTLLTSNNTFTETANYYWLDERFDDGYYDLSALESITFNNIGGITDYLDFSDKSEAALESIDFGVLEVVQGGFYLSGFGGVLQTITADNLKSIENTFEMYSNGFTDGPNVVFPELGRIGGDLYLDYNNYYNGLANTAAPSFPVLQRVEGSVYIYQNSFKSYSSFPQLEYVDWEFGFYNNYGEEGQGSYSAPGAPALTHVRGYIEIYNNSNMSSIPAFTNLTNVNYELRIYDNYDLTAFPSFPALQNIYYSGINASGCTSMTTVGTFLPSIKRINGNVSFENCALDQASVDAILVKLASLDGSNGTTVYEYQNIYVHNGTNAYPSETGLDAITTLQGRGCNVYYNSP